jgi:uncharacterized protein YpuA (DUF1002 family)
MVKKKKKFKITARAKKIAVGVGAGLAAAAAAGAAANYFFGKKGAQHRRQAKSWAHKVKKQVVAQAKKVKKLDQKVYNQIVDAVAEESKALQGVDMQELKQLAGKLKGDWQKIQKQAGTVKKAVKKVFRKKR